MVEGHGLEGGDYGFRAILERGGGGGVGPFYRTNGNME